MNRSTYRNNHSMVNMMMIDNRLEYLIKKKMTFILFNSSYRLNNSIAVDRAFE